jgi:3-deoxy-D-manno-octulosonic-acid transferase
MRSSRPLSVRAYSGLSRLLYPAVSALLVKRRKRGKEDPLRYTERKGFASVPRPQGTLIWLHGASVGEVISLLPIAEHFCKRGQTVLVTSGTVTSAEVAARRLPDGAIHQYAPVDLPAYVGRFLDHWKPDIGIFAESELWPNLVHAAQARGAHLVIVNARMSERSFQRWQKIPAFILSILSRFELVLAQTEADALRLQKLGASRVSTVGNLKYDVDVPPTDAAKFRIIKEAIQDRVVFIAASTHPGEEETVAEAHRIACEQVPNLLTIIVPRHPERGPAIRESLIQSGFNVCCRSQSLLPDIQTDIYIADTIGEMGLNYRLSPLTYLGGSLAQKGGQNPIEPAKLGNAILHGPYVRNFTEVYELLTASGGAFLVQDAKALGTAVGRLLSDPILLSRMGEAAERSVQAMAGANQRTLNAIEPLLVQIHLERGG